ncbi:hypothetical protein EYF80_042703 [Liparis tanakae]|uniref:Uncharacterized protein n=1 Tax=Liparis tanakae TaxID=230148 RepID=A0A4Z2G1D9_9TELE|nr:hypothetical protein EYF80_042703 [Liparis tanakae]
MWSSERELDSIKSGLQTLPASSAHAHPSEVLQLPRRRRVPGRSPRADGSFPVATAPCAVKSSPTLKPITTKEDNGVHGDHGLSCDRSTKSVQPVGVRLCRTSFHSRDGERFFLVTFSRLVLLGLAEGQRGQLDRPAGQPPHQVGLQAEDRPRLQGVGRIIRHLVEEKRSREARATWKLRLCRSEVRRRETENVNVEETQQAVSIR